MVESKQDKIFNTKVIPIMNKVRNDLQNKLADELRSNSNSFAGLMAAAGPDGGMASMQAQNDTLKYTGKWTSKTTEDYIAMVKKELKRQHITVNASMEQKMIDKMIKDKIPKSSIDYIMRKAATSTIFYLPQEVAKSPLEHKIDSEAEKRYKPSVWEKNAGIALGSVTDLACMGGLGGGLKTAATWIGSDMLVTHVGDKLNDRSDVPMIIAPGKEDEYRRTQQEKKKQAEQKPQNKPQSEEGAQQTEPSEEGNQSEGEANNTQPEQTNMNGWQGLLTSFGLNGISDIGHNLGYVLAMLPDMLVGMGGMNLLNKAGHEALDNFKAQDHPQQAGGRVNYRIYPEEPLNARIQNPEIRANCLIATIDRVPCTIALPEKVVDAYRQGALPLNTLANAVLAKNDQMRQIASEKYEAGERQTVIERPLAQR